MHPDHAAWLDVAEYNAAYSSIATCIIYRGGKFRSFRRMSSLVDSKNDLPLHAMVNSCWYRCFVFVLEYSLLSIFSLLIIEILSAGAQMKMTPPPVTTRVRSHYRFRPISNYSQNALNLPNYKILMRPDSHRRRAAAGAGGPLRRGGARGRGEVHGPLPGPGPPRGGSAIKGLPSPAIKCITRTAHSEALIVRGTGCDVDHLDQPRGGSMPFSAHLH